MSVSSRLTALFSTIKAVFEELKQIDTDKGPLFIDGPIEPGSPAFLEPGVPASGSYIYDNNTILIEDGVIKSIEPIEVTGEPAPAAPAAPDSLACAKKECTEAEPAEPAEPTLEEPSADEALQAKVEDILNRVIVLESRLAEIEGRPIDKRPDEFASVKPSRPLGINVDALKDAFNL